MNKVTTSLLTALKTALVEAGEQRLFKSGKLPGLFPSRSGANGEAAELALRDGLLEVVRTETKGKTEWKWVKPTPKAVDFVHRHEAPVAALRDLQHILQTTQMSLPLWMADIQSKIRDLADGVTAEVSRISHRLDSLSRRVEEAIARAEAAGPAIPDELADSVPWSGAALRYLDVRRENAQEGPCALSEMFAALRQSHPELTVAEFHAGLRRLFDRGLVRLLPFAETGGLPEPEYALLDGLYTYYFVARAGNKAA